jgi:pyruvate dehydrogenase E2 component (dihydrolipoamide acetyltransferase)
MARWEFRLPDLGEGVTEGEIVSFLVKAGELVVEDQPMVELMTDKATVTITAPRSGIIVETRGGVGDMVPVNAVLVVFDLDSPSATPPRGSNGSSHGLSGDAGPSRPSDRPMGTVSPSRTEARPSAHGPGEAPRGGTARHQVTEVPAQPTGEVLGDVDRQYRSEAPLATPATRKLARDRNVDLRRVPPSGPQGRVTKKDVDAYVDAEAKRATPSSLPVHVRSSSAQSSHPSSAEQRVPFAGLRRRISQRLSLASHTVVPLTFVEECDVSKLKALRTELAAAAASNGVKLTYLPFIVKAVVGALRRHPGLNATLDEEAHEIVLRRYFHIGIATATEAGLLVPVVRDADRKSLLDIARDIDRLASDARAGRAKLEDLQGSTFTITSLGAKGGLLATPIVNYPEVAILGVHRIIERPVVRDGHIVIGDVMLLSLSFDHRVVDGDVAATFAYDVIETLQQPSRLLLEMA